MKEYVKGKGENVVEVVLLERERDAMKNVCVEGEEAFVSAAYLRNVVEYMRNKTM